MPTLEIIELCIIIIGIVAIVSYVIIKGVKEKWFSKLLNTIEISIKEAEKLFPESGSGSQKKAYVVDKIKDKCKELGIPYSILKKLVDVAIDKIVSNYNIFIK